MIKPIVAVDLFCGGGGTSTGFAEAVKETGRSAELLAINCWAKAIETHQANHPWAKHLCARVESIHPESLWAELFPQQRLDGLMASPECIFHSVARGGKPVNDQLRASPWVIPRWLEALEPDWFFIENVPEFQNWGPLYGAGPKRGRPNPKLKGQRFRVWQDALKTSGPGYTVEARVLNAADYGAVTTRRRVFIAGRKGNHRTVPWPKPTHDKQARNGLSKWRAAREILDFTLPNRSIFDPEKPLAWNTMRRIAIGARRFWGIDLKPFLVKLYGTSTVADLDDATPAVTGQGGHLGLVEPFIVQPTHGGRLHDPKDPAPTITGAHRGELGVAEPLVFGTGGRNRELRSSEDPLKTLLPRDGPAVVEPFVLGQGGGGSARSADEPLPTHHADGHMRVVQPFLLPPEGYYRGNNPRSANDPVQTLTQRAGQIRLLEPMMMTIDRPRTNRSLPRGAWEPVPTAVGHDRTAVLQPFLVPNKGERDGQAPRAESLDAPLHVVTATGNTGNVVEPLMVEYYRNGRARPVSEPVPVLHTKDRVALAIPLSDGRFLDIRFRMLAVKELSAAMGFPPEYRFVGTKTDAVKMIGNAVEKNQAKAIALSLMRGRRVGIQDFGVAA